MRSHKSLTSMKDDYFGNHRNGVEGIPNTVLVSTSLLQEVTFLLVSSLVDLFFM